MGNPDTDTPWVRYRRLTCPQATKESQCSQDTQQRQLDQKPWKYKFLYIKKVSPVNTE